MLCVFCIRCRYRLQSYDKSMYFATIIRVKIGFYYIVSFNNNIF